MEPPAKRGTQEAFDDAVAAHLNANCTLVDNQYRCKACNTKILEVPCYISVHHAEWNGCAGGGGVRVRVLPHCRNCEGAAKQSYATCVHE